MRQGDISSSLTVNFSVGGTATSGTDYTSIGTSVTFAAGEDFAIVEVDAADESSSDANETVTVTIQSGTGYTIGDDDSASLKIIDASSPFVTVETIDDGVEGGTNGKVRFTRTGSTSGSLTVYYTVGGDATSGDDYTALTGSVTIASGDASADVTMTITDDSDDESGEYISVEITPDSNYEIGASASAVVLIDDNDLPEVEVTKVVDAAETDGYGIFRFSRTLGEIGDELTVSYSVGGTATSGTDYDSLAGSVTFGVGEAVVDVVVTPVTDMSTEGTETVTVTITSGSYTIGTSSSASMDILEESAGAISGKLWNDADSDGVIDGGETGVAGSNVFLIKGLKIVARTLTDASGNFAFAGIAVGNYDVSFDMSGRTPTVTTEGSQPVTVTAGNTTTDVSEGCAPPPADTADPAAGVPGIKWSTLTRVGAATTNEGIVGSNYTVKVQRGGKLADITVALFAADPADRQPDKVKVAGYFINNNCHGYSMDFTGIVVGGKTYNFAVLDLDSAFALFTTRGLYQSATAQEAKKALAAGKTVLGVWTGDGFPPPYLHSVKMTTIALMGNDIDIAKSFCNSKYLWEDAKLNVKCSDIDSLCRNPPKINNMDQVKATGFLLLIKQ